MKKRRQLRRLASSVFARTVEKFGAPDTIRTCDLCLRRATLYPAELRVLRGFIYPIGRAGATALRGGRGSPEGKGDGIRVALGAPGKHVPRMPGCAGGEQKPRHSEERA
jgi:hypothetical protein